ncbi:uncharacterized protein LOC144169936 isoform X2 [Haemaphysalis longicornis]
MEKVAVNNLVLNLRRRLKTERVLLIRKMMGQIKKLGEAKGPHAERKKQKGERWNNQVKFLKKVDLLIVARQALAAEEPWQNVLVRKDSTPEQRAVARLVGRPTVHKIIDQFRKENEDWKEWLPKVYEAWEKRKLAVPRKKEKPEGPHTGPLATSTPQVKRKVLGKAGQKKGPVASSDKGESAAKGDTTPGAAEAPSTGAPRPLAKKKVLVKKTGKANVTAKGSTGTAKESQSPGGKPKGLPVQSSGDAEKAVTNAAAQTKEAEEPPPRKFAAGDPFFCHGDKADPGPAGSPPPKKQRPPAFRERPFPNQSRSFGGPPGGPNRKERRNSEFRPGAGAGNSWKQGRRSEGFRPGAGNARQSPAAKRATPPSAKKGPEDTDLHPSWAAKRQSQKALVPFQGKKTTFS